MSAVDLGGGHEANDSICRHRFLGYNEVLPFFPFTVHKKWVCRCSVYLTWDLLLFARALSGAPCNIWDGVGAAEQSDSIPLILIGIHGVQS